MQNRDILWAVSIPFRMYNTKELNINQYIFTLSFDAALKDVDVSTARKLVYLAIEKGWIEQDKKANVYRAQFELWEPKFFPPSWKPSFKGLEKVPKMDLLPLENSVQYKPRIIKEIKKPKSGSGVFKSILDQSKAAVLNVDEKKRRREERQEEEEKKVDPVIEPETPIQKPIEKEKSSKKLKPLKKEKTKGQKSLQDFFG